MFVKVGMFTGVSLAVPRDAKTSLHSGNARKPGQGINGRNLGV